MNCPLSKNQCHLTRFVPHICLKILMYFPSRTFTALLGPREPAIETTSPLLQQSKKYLKGPRTSGWNHIATSPTRKSIWRVRENQWSKPHRHFSNKKKFNGPIFFPYFVPHILFVPNLSKFYWLCLFVCLLVWFVFSPNLKIPFLHPNLLLVFSEKWKFVVEFCCKKESETGNMIFFGDLLTVWQLDAD